MNFQSFKNSISDKNPPDGISEILKALWYDANNDWELAHNIAQSDEGNKPYDHLHAYLHRKEGDVFNAKYWYNSAKTKFPSVNLAQEWEDLVHENL
jgi:hypothetical protein